MSLSTTGAIRRQPWSAQALRQHDAEEAMHRAKLAAANQNFVAALYRAHRDEFPWLYEGPGVTTVAVQTAGPVLPYFSGVVTVTDGGECPFGGEHTCRWWHDRRGVACYRCHKTWRFTEGGFAPTRP